uniref:Caveolae associated protein 1 n=1 Tax=Gasterosteus aculeatus aculeatus TaxID=481459 RepID=A0AAQ4RGG9_GASAC
TGSWSSLCWTRSSGWSTRSSRPRTGWRPGRRPWRSRCPPSRGSWGSCPRTTSALPTPSTRCWTRCARSASTSRRCAATWRSRRARSRGWRATRTSCSRDATSKSSSTRTHTRLHQRGSLGRRNKKQNPRSAESLQERHRYPFELLELHLGACQKASTLSDKVKPVKTHSAAETVVEGQSVEGLEQIPEGQEEPGHLNLDEEVEIEEIVEESRTKRLQRTTKQQMDNIKKVFSKEEMEKTKLKTKENLEKTRQRTRDNLEKTRQRTRDNLEKTKHSLEMKMGKLGNRMTPNTERRAKMKSSRENAKKSLTPDHTVYARSKTSVYRVPPFTFHVKKIREGEEEEEQVVVVQKTEMEEGSEGGEGQLGGEENGLGVHVEVEEGELVSLDSPEMEALLEVTEDRQLVRMEPEDLKKAQSD